MSLASTIDSATAQREIWDAIVIGGGPAGAVAAYSLARRQRRVLLIERKLLPRYKVCGACLSSSAVQALGATGLGDVVDALPHVRLKRMMLRSGAARCAISLAGANGMSGVAIARDELDRHLVQAAVQNGAQLLLGHTAHVLPVSEKSEIHRLVTVQHGSRSDTLRARLVIVAAGLAGLSKATEDVTERVDPTARIGLGATYHAAPDDYPAGSICMAVGRQGYLGAVKLADGRLNVAAAVDRTWIREAGGPEHAAQQLLAQNGFPPLEPSAETVWYGTPALTRSPQRVSAYRVLTAGDAAGYVEPFTGEGMAWAIESGKAAAELANDGIDHWSQEIERRWQRWFACVLRGRQSRCRRLAEWLRYPRAVRYTILAAERLPGLAALVARQFHRATPERHP